MSSFKKKFDQTCFFWHMKKDCRYGDKCKYQHQETGTVAPAPDGWVDYSKKPFKSKHSENNNDNTATEEERGEGEEEGVTPSNSPLYNFSRWSKLRMKSSSFNDESIPEAPEAPEAPDAAKIEEDKKFIYDGTITDGSVSEELMLIDDRTESDNGKAKVKGPSEIIDIWEILDPGTAFPRWSKFSYSEISATSAFDVNFLVWLLSKNPFHFQFSRVQEYLNRFSVETTRSHINNSSSTHSIPTMFFAVATNCRPAVELCIDFGGDVESKAGADGIPLLAFAIMHGGKFNRDTTDIVRTLLAHGADASVIPSQLYSDYLTSVNLPTYDFENHQTIIMNADRTNWCVGKYYNKLRTTITINQRYCLEKSKRQRKSTPRELKVAQIENCTRLLQVPYLLIGQEIASSLLIKKLLSHFLISKYRSKPIVMMFAGPSGHGKTHLAGSLGDSLSVDYISIDCTEMRHSTDLLGPRTRYAGEDKGSPLNNFLCRNKGKRCVVVLDGFEKMGRDVHETLLVPFDEGKYHDRRDSSTVIPIDCSQVIWVLVTNAMDHVIEDFYQTHKSILQFPEQHETGEIERLVKELEEKILKILNSKFGAPSAGRLSNIFPFFPFSMGEQAVLANKYFLELKRDLAEKVDIGKGNIFGNIVLEMEDESKVCQVLAKAGYDSSTGARSIEREVKDLIQVGVANSWLASDGDVCDETGGDLLESYIVYTRPLNGGEHICVRKI